MTPNGVDFFPPFFLLSLPGSTDSKLQHFKVHGPAYLCSKHSLQKLAVLQCPICRFAYIISKVIVEVSRYLWLWTASPGCCCLDRQPPTDPL